jgi:hypothetical protein
VEGPQAALVGQTSCCLLYSLLFEIWFNMIEQNGDELCTFIALGSSRGGIYCPSCRKPRSQPVQPRARMGGRRLSSVVPRLHNTLYEAKETCAWSMTRTSLFSWLVANLEWFEQGTNPGEGDSTQPDDKQRHVHLVRSSCSIMSRSYLCGCLPVERAEWR